jgi:type II secretory pathway pseudopilin PulG
MVELVIVVLIMGIFAAVAMPAFYDSLLFHRVESAARRVKSDLDLMRQTARLTSAQQTFTVIGLKYTASAAVADLDRPTQSYSVDLSKPPYAIDVLAANFGGLTEVHFDGYGKPSSGGTVILQCSNHQCTVTLDGATGQATISSNHTGGRSAKVLTN